MIERSFPLWDSSSKHRAGFSGQCWRLSAGTDTAWKEDGDIILAPAGRYRIRFKKTPGFIKPNRLKINVHEGEFIEKTGSYMPR